jgi:hypothetical protein
MPNEIKNEKLREDIKKNLPAGEAKLALDLLSEIEKSDGQEVDMTLAKKIANQAFAEASKKD